jgi:hypothetical protein
MVKRLIWLAASLGYRGQFFQVMFPSQDDRVVQLSEELESKGKFVRRQIQGRLKNGKTNGEKLTLEIHDSDSKPVFNVPDVDFIINSMGKTHITHLINALIEKGYIQEGDAAHGDTSLHSSHPMLSGYDPLFQGDFVVEDVTSPGIWLKPWDASSKTQPNGWEEAFNVACKMLGKCT